jgi:hypothetical protein
LEKLIVLQNDPNALKLAKIADLLGVGCELVSEIPREPSCMILPGPYSDKFQEDILQAEHTVLVYNAGLSETFAAQLRPFRHASNRIRIGNARRDVTSSLSGLSFQTAVTETVFSSFQGFEPLVFMDEHPIFLARGRLFLLAADRVLDIDMEGKEGCEPYREHFTELLPFVMFIKTVLKERCWRLPEQYACIIVDDPLLRRRHGFIDIPVFVEWLRANSLAATFAFIPWNHDRSRAAIAELFNRNSDRLSICVHGCDHTEAEFAIADAAHLDAMARTAMTRMAAHEREHAIRHDRIMIFPQGKFTRYALVALQRNGYMAAVNTSLFPTNDFWNPTVRELLDLALVIPHGVPLFNRRYPVDLFDFACDIFFEKPVLIVQHHRDFRSGFESLQSFIRDLDRIKPGMKWLPLGALLAQSIWHRAESNGTVRTRKLVREGQEGTWAEVEYSPKARAKIALKRYLSEFRDNHIDRSKLMTFVVKAIRKESDGQGS